MSAYVWWFVLGFVLLIAELMTGTFYLLVIAVAFGAAGVASLLGASVSLQLLVAAAIGFGGAMWLRKTRFGRAGRNAEKGRDPGDRLQNLDVGQIVRIDQWLPNRTARASYRGAQWDVELAAGEDAAPGDFEIREILANRLIVARRARS